MRKIVWVVVATLMVFGVLAGCSSTDSENVRTVVVGTGNAYPPFCYQDESGESVGFDKAILEAVDAKLPQYKFKYQILEFKNILTALATGNITIGAHQYEANDERRANYLFSEEGYYDYTSYLAFFEGGTRYETLKELEGKTITVGVGSNHAYIVDEYNRTEATEPIKLLYYEASMDVIIANLESGSADAIMMTKPDIERWNQMREKKLAVSKEPCYVSLSYFLFGKGETELQTAVDEALRELKASGEYDKILQAKVIDFYAGNS
jgi:L-cystine transport system substrate-binding protein